MGGVEKEKPNDPEKLEFMQSIVSGTVVVADTMTSFNTASTDSAAGHKGTWVSYTEFCDKHGDKVVSTMLKYKKAVYKRYAWLPADQTELLWPEDSEFALVREVWENIRRGSSGTTTSGTASIDGDEAAMHAEVVAAMLTDDPAVASEETGILRGEPLATDEPNAALNTQQMKQLDVL